MYENYVPMNCLTLYSMNEVQLSHGTPPFFSEPVLGPVASKAKSYGRSGALAATGKPLPGNYPNTTHAGSSSHVSEANIVCRSPLASLCFSGALR